RAGSSVAQLHISSGSGETAFPTAPAPRLRALAGFGPALGFGMLLALLVFPPLVILIHMSFSKDGGGGWTLANYASLFSDPRLGTTFFNTLVFSFGATAVSLLFGGVLAWIVERTDAPLKPLAYLTATI